MRKEGPGVQPLEATEEHAFTPSRGGTKAGSPCYAAHMIENTEMRGPESEGGAEDPSQGTALDAVARQILDQLGALAPGRSLSPAEIAQAFAEPRRKKSDRPDHWRKYMNAVRQQALHLARAGRIVILRRGQPQDPKAPIKGVIRLALPGDGAKAES